MPRRSILTARQRAALIDLPKDDASILYHYTLSDHDIEIIRTRRHARNRLGFALQLCAFRYPGRLLVSGEVIPEAVSRFIAAQLGEEMDELSRYAETDVTRRRHLVDLRQAYGFRMFSGHRARELKAWRARRRTRPPTMIWPADLSMSVAGLRPSCRVYLSSSASVRMRLSRRNAGSTAPSWLGWTSP